MIAVTDAAKRRFEQARTFAQPSPELRKAARRRLVKFNERGDRIGESNPAAVLTDRDVELLLELRAEVDERGKALHSYRWLAEKFEVSRDAVKSICLGRRRNQSIARVTFEEVVT